MLNIPRATYYDERKRIANHQDKYEYVKQLIQKFADQGKVRDQFTYGYRRISALLENEGVHLADATIIKLMKQLKVQVKLYNRHRNGDYSSYAGTVGKIAPNHLNQSFDAKEPYQVLHTDVTQVRLADQHWAYISAITDEATKETLAFQASYHPDRGLITATLDELLTKLPANATPVIHSDQGWHYQLPYYVEKLKDHQFIQSMSRKGNCLDNAPIESFFHLYKTELLHGYPPCHSLEELKTISQDYLHFYNYHRISLKTKGMSPVEYRTHTLSV